MTGATPTTCLSGKGLLVGFDEAARLVLWATGREGAPQHGVLMRALGLSSADRYVALNVYDDDTFEILLGRSEERRATLTALARLRPSMTEYVDPYADLWNFT